MTFLWLFTSVADPGCLSRILIFTHPGSRISEPGSKNSNKRKGRGWKFFFCHIFFCSHKFHKFENYFIFEMLKTKIWPRFQRIIELFIQKFVTKVSKYGLGIRDPGSEKDLFRIPDPGPGVKRHRIRIRNTAFYQCSGSASGFGSVGSVCFWASRIRVGIR